MLPRPERIQFLEEQLPEYPQWYELLSDFCFGGYRVLGDLICDMDDAFQARERKQFHRNEDSLFFTFMMNAYENKTYDQSTREAVAGACRTLLDELVIAGEAVKYVVAAGYRNELWDILEDRIEAAALERRP